MGGPWRMRLFGWLLSFLTLMAAHAWWFVGARVVAAVDRSILNEGRVWQLPLAEWLTDDSLSIVPYWVFAAAISFLLAVLCFRPTTGGSKFGGLNFLTLISSSLVVRPHDLIPVACILLGVAAIRRSVGQSLWKAVVASIVLLAVSTLVTLEVGLVALFVLLALFTSQEHATDGEPPGRPAVTAMWVKIIAAAVAGLLVPDYGRLLLRPCTAAMQSPVLFPELNLLAGDSWTIAGRVGCLLAIAMLVTNSLTSRQPIASKLLHVVIGVIAALSAFYTAMAAVGLLYVRNDPRVAVANRSRRIPLPIFVTVSVLVVAAVWVSSFQSAGWNAFGGSTYAVQFDAAEWNFDGPILLTNLQQSDDWQRADVAKKFSLLRSERWDADTEHADAYARAVDDLLHGRREFFRRTDLTEGGYRIFLDEHQPVAVVLDSRQLDAIRHLSVDPVWRIMALDSRRVAFGRQDRPATQGQIAQCSRLLQRMEWPQQAGGSFPERVIALGLSSNARRVAAVLNAIRLPYAALRMIASDSSAAADYVRCFSYTELAHRVLRQTGQRSKLDHHRALKALQRQQERLLQTPENATRIRRALRMLRDETIEVTLMDFPHQGIADHGSENRHDRKRGEHKSTTSPIGNKNLGAIEAMLTDRITSDSDELLPDLVALAADSSAADFVRQEAWFYAGCLALELGEMGRARKCFENGMSEEVETPLSGMIAYYLSQIR